MNGDYQKNKQIWAELMDMVPVGICILIVENDDKGLPKNVIYDYVNQAYADLYGIKREEHMGKSIFDIDSDVDRKYLYSVWSVAYDNATKEREFFESKCNKYLKCILFPIEQGICGSIVEDNTINKKIIQMLHNKEKSL